WFRS
ncbi:peptide transport system permease sapB domain protein, partial [Vibrio parahaemolyticus V-223/04]